MDLLPGDVLLTRNTDGAGNPNPGHWNHSAIVSPIDYMIEAQTNMGVIAVPTQFFLRRYPEILQLRPHNDIRQAMAQRAVSFVGREYKILASWTPYHSNGDNCVSVVRKAYEHSVDIWVPWRRPDHILYSGKFSIISQKQSQEGWIDPIDPYKGALKVFPSIKINQPE